MREIGRADHASARRVLKVRHPFIDRHNGGELAFGPDGFLYLSVGDGSFADEERRAQAKGSLLGKLLRIDPRRVRRCHGRTDRRQAAHSGERCGPRPRPYTSPAKNPFSGDIPGRAEVYALGFRNPYRYSFDSSGTPTSESFCGLAPVIRIRACRSSSAARYCFTCTADSA